ncbi:hypothetical protein UF31_21065, partial [Vibrio parahaemolyticus]
LTISSSQITQMNNMHNPFIDFKPLEYAPAFAFHLFFRIQHQPWAKLLRLVHQTHIDSHLAGLAVRPRHWQKLRALAVTRFMSQTTTAGKGRSLAKMV